MRILIADDERIIADTLALIFRSRGMEALAVYSGESVIEIAESFAPNVLISDVVMGGIDGFRAGEFVSRRVPGCAVLLFSGQAATPELAQQSRSMGYAFDVLTKPVHPRILLDYVDARARISRSPAY